MAAQYGLDPGIFERQIDQESKFNPKAVSPAGAQGIAQFMPATATGVGLADPFEPYAALDAAARHMADNLKTNAGDYARALAAYNAGQGNVNKHGGVPPFAETQEYIRRILGDARPTADLGQVARAAGMVTGPVGAALGSAAAGVLGAGAAPRAEAAPAPAGAAPARAAAAGLDVSGITKEYAGQPYVFGGGGGRSTFAPGTPTDCSGFVASVWKNRYGLDLPAHTDTSYNQLKQLGAAEIAPTEARPGDVVYYMGAGTGGAITHHMGIFAGPGKVLDMSTSGQSGVAVRDIGHGGRYVILRDPRVNAQPAQTAAAPPPIVPTGVAERTGGEKVPQRQVDALSLRAARPDQRLALVSGPGLVSDVSYGMGEAYDPDQGPREATPGSTGASSLPVIGLPATQPTLPAAVAGPVSSSVWDTITAPVGSAIQGISSGISGLDDRRRQEIEAEPALPASPLPAELPTRNPLPVLGEAAGAALRAADPYLTGPARTLPTWQDPLAPVREVTEHVRQNPLSVLPAAIYGDIQGAAADVIGRRTVEAAGGGTEPVISGTVPAGAPLVGGSPYAFSPQDIGSGVAQVVLDPLNVIGPPAAAKAAPAAARGARAVGARVGAAVDDAARGIAAAVPTGPPVEGIQMLGGGFVPAGSDIVSRARQAEQALEAAADALRAADAGVVAAERAGDLVAIRAADAGYGHVRRQYDAAEAAVEALRPGMQRREAAVEAAGFGRPVEEVGFANEGAAVPGDTRVRGPVSPFVDTSPREISLGAGLVPDARYMSGGFRPKPTLPRAVREAEGVMHEALSDSLNARQAREALEARARTAPHDRELQQDLMNAVADEDLAKDRLAAAREWVQMVRTGDMTLPSGLAARLRAPAFNFAQGGFMGGASEILQAQAEDRETDPAEMARRALLLGAAGVGAGIVARRGAGRALGSGVVPEGSRYDPRLAREPVLPGIEPPRRTERIPDVSDLPNRTPVLGDVPASAIRQPLLPGMEPPAPAPLGQAVDAMLGPAAEGAPAPSMAGQLPGMPPPKGPSFWEWLKKIGYTGMLGPTTAASQTVGGVVQTGLAVEKAIARAMAEGRPGSAGRIVGASVRAVPEAFRSLFEVLRGGQAEAGISAAWGGSTARMADRVATPIGRAVARALDYSTALWTQAPDAFFSPIFRAIGEREAAEQVARRTGGSADQLMADAVAARQAGTRAGSSEVQEVMDAGRKLADDLGFRGDPGAVGTKLAALAARDDAIGFLASFLLPFPSMTARSLKATGRLVPGVGEVIGRREGRDAFERLHDQMLGPVGLAAMGYYAAQGGVTGGGPTDTGRRDLLVARGWQPHSVLVPGVGYVPTRYFQQWAPILDAVGEVHDAYAYGKQGVDKAAVLGDAASRIGRLATDQVGLSQLNDLLQVLDGSQSGSQVAGFAARSLGRYIPFGATLRQAASVIDPTARRPVGREPGEILPLASFVQNLEQGLPGLRGLVPARQDVLGRAMPNPQRGLQPAMRTEPMLRAFERAGLTLGDPPGTITDPTTGNERALTAAQQARWRTAYGRALRSGWADNGSPTDTETLGAVKRAARDEADALVLGR